MSLHPKAPRKSGRMLILSALSVSVLSLVSIIPAEARPGLGGGGHGGGSIHVNPGGGGYHPSGGGPRPHPHPGPPPPHPGPRPHPGPHPYYPGGRIPWVPGALVWGAAVTADMLHDYDVIYTLPSQCNKVTVSGGTYLNCTNGRWYQMVYEGNQIAYVQVPDPR
jgi:hypothetical protein